MQNTFVVSFNITKRIAAMGEKAQFPLQTK